MLNQPKISINFLLAGVTTCLWGCTHQTSTPLSSSERLDWIRHDIKQIDHQRFLSELAEYDEIEILSYLESSSRVESAEVRLISEHSYQELEKSPNFFVQVILTLNEPADEKWISDLIYEAFDSADLDLRLLFGSFQAITYGEEPERPMLDLVIDGLDVGLEFALAHPKPDQWTVEPSPCFPPDEESNDAQNP